jgi:hypothetical protein
VWYQRRTIASRESAVGTSATLLAFVTGPHLSGSPTSAGHSALAVHEYTQPHRALTGVTLRISESGPVAPLVGSGRSQLGIQSHRMRS